MTYKTILLQLDATAQCTARMDLAFRLASASDAHLVGLAVTAPLLVPGTSPTEMMIDVLIEQWEADRFGLAEVAGAFVRKARLGGVSRVESRSVVGAPEHELALHGRYADLIVIGQASSSEHDIAAGLVLNAGRPVLIVPRVGESDRTGERILVAWNASREATRAVTDALPLLARASRVDVVTVNAEPRREGHGELPGADIALYLARHGVRCNVLPTSGDDIEVGAWLLSRAADLGSDLIVMGAYGHSRLRELMLGGATRTVLGSMTVPVLMSH